MPEGGVRVTPLLERQETTVPQGAVVFFIADHYPPLVARLSKNQ
jgi:hypothetical protein